MRFWIIAALGIALLEFTLAGAAMAQGNGVGHAFGSANCSPPVSCPYDANYMSSDSLVANANACITRYFGYTNSSGFFEESGLDGNNCLTALPNILPKGVGQRLSPRCCVMQYPDNSCAFHCELITTQ